VSALEQVIDEEFHEKKGEGGRKMLLFLQAKK